MIFQLQTSLYQTWLKTMDQISISLTGISGTVKTQLEIKLIDFSEHLALALKQKDKKSINDSLLEIEELLFGIHHHLHLLKHQKLIDQEIFNTQVKSIKAFEQELIHFINFRPTILILSSMMGQGHMSASKAIKQGLETLYGQDYNIEIVDFFEQIGSFFNKATLSAYEGTTKYAPKIYKAFFDSTDSQWPVKLLNLINYPINSSKIEKFFKSSDPALVISTFPIWDFLASLVLKKMSPRPFISVVTDSISIHNVWNTGSPDFHIVANEETAVSLKKLGVVDSKIKVLGFPVRTELMHAVDRHTILTGLNLKPDNFTVLYLPTADKPKIAIKTMQELVNHYPQYNLIVVCGRNIELYPKLKEKKWPQNVHIINWTNQLPSYLLSSDLVITKAGGATVMECIAARKPMIITNIIPGQETGNAELVKLYNLGIVQKQAKMTISESVEYINRNLEFYQKNFAKISKPEAALTIAKFVKSQLQI